jgi:RNA polymerase sigma-70 factor, ECF subfamily
MSGPKLRLLPAVSARQDTMSDDELVAACGAGGTAALGMLYDRFHGDVLRFLSRLLGARCPVLDDLAQATFVEVWKSAARFGRRSTVKSWILAIAHNLARRHIRQEIRKRSALAVLEGGAHDWVRSHEQLVGDKILVERLSASLATLDADLRTAFVMCDLEEISGVDAARALGVRPGTMWRRLFQARRALRAALKEER